MGMKIKISIKTFYRRWEYIKNRKREVNTLRKKYAANGEALAPIEAKLAEVRALNLNDASYDWRSLMAEINKLVNDAAQQLAE